MMEEGSMFADGVVFACGIVILGVLVAGLAGSPCQEIGIFYGPSPTLGRYLVDDIDVLDGGQTVRDD